MKNIQTQYSQNKTRKKIFENQKYMNQYNPCIRMFDLLKKCANGKHIKRNQRTLDKTTKFNCVKFIMKCRQMAKD